MFSLFHFRKTKKKVKKQYQAAAKFLVVDYNTRTLAFYALFHSFMLRTHSINPLY